MLTEAIAAARAGDRGRARKLLARLLSSDSGNAEYWVWMSSVVATKREQIYCLEAALNADPTNRAALRGLEVLGARQPEETPRKKVKVPRREVAPSKRAKSRSGLKFSWRMVGGALVGLVVLTVLAGGVLALQRLPMPAIVAPTLPPPTDTPTVTPEIPTPTLTPIPAETRTFRTPIPTDLAATPISFFVGATPTATPIVGLTPRPGYEAYSSGIVALQRGDYEQAVEFMEQVIEIDEDLPDPYYFMGEALRLGGQPGQAVLAYDQATLADREYAPAFLGRALAIIDITLRQNGELRSRDLPADFDRAIDRDPLFSAAYLEKAEFYGTVRLWEKMDETLQAAFDQGLRDPILYIRHSLAKYNRDQFELSLEAATQGSAGDPTNLEGYKAIGRAHVALEQYEQGSWPLQTYVAYAPDDHTGWGYLARAQWDLRDYERARESANRALEINDRYAHAYITRALVRVERGEFQEALDDLRQARRFGSANYYLAYGFGTVYYHLGENADAIRSISESIALARTPAQKADGYALMALVYENLDPP
ncbi:MAG: tetratricopeptide repeat protein, partial [Anaerolineales bacterium]